MSDLNSDIRFLKGVGEKRAAILYNMGIDTVGALLRYYPRDYKDFSSPVPLAECMGEEKVCIKARIISPVSEHYIRKNMTLFKFNISDSTAVCSVTLFNNKYLASSLHEGSEYLFYGKITDGGNFLPAIVSPEISPVGAKGIHPVYKASGKMSSRALEKLVKTAFSCGFPDDPIPLEIREKYKLCPLSDALMNIHFPKNFEALKSAERRLVFEELFILQTGLMLLKCQKKQKQNPVIKKDYTNEFLSLLPFSLTSAQLRAINDCVKDMSGKNKMNRLVEGDVGSGKTAVAAALIYNTVKNGFQAVMMAPTEILAEQHFKTLNTFFKDTDISVCLLTGSVTKLKKNKLKAQLKSGEINVAVGTHALLTDDTEFLNAGLFITDEQHRFGVGQRAALAQKGRVVNMLVMSATPIPRTLGLVIYGDLDISIIDEYPKGRQKIETYLINSEIRTRAFNYVKKHLDVGRQGYIVCPLVEEGETDAKIINAQDYFEKIKNGPFSDYRVGLIHGKMKPNQKENVMRRFKDGEIDLLVCTTVIEVGIDVPNAAIMIIENAERFGLSQLHQLRGRIGRGGFKSTCILISDAKNKITLERLSVIKKNSDGFKIAEEDMRLRGPGDFLGQRQHGLPELKIADLFADTASLKAAGESAKYILSSDPELKSAENGTLRKEINNLYKKLENTQN